MSATSSIESAFLAAIWAAPSDPTPRLVFADWLQENGREEEAAEQREKAEAPAVEGEEAIEAYSAAAEKFGAVRLRQYSPNGGRGNAVGSEFWAGEDYLSETLEEATEEYDSVLWTGEALELASTPARSVHQYFTLTPTESPEPDGERLALNSAAAGWLWEREECNGCDVLRELLTGWADRERAGIESCEDWEHGEKDCAILVITDPTVFGPIEAACKLAQERLESADREDLASEAAESIARRFNLIG